MNIFNFAFCVLTFSLSAWAEMPLNFQKTFEIGSGKYAVNGGKFVPYECKKKGLFKKIKFKNKTLDITCDIDDIPTFLLGDQIIVQRGGDAGDVWEKQAIIFPSPENELIIYVKHFSSHDYSFECDTMTKEEQKKEMIVCPSKKIRCNDFSETFKWNEKAKKYTSFAYLGEVPKMQLKRSDYHLKNCK